MSLNKLFNYKYLLQNIKKSKMAIGLFFIVVPIFTSLLIIAAEDTSLNFISLASYNIVGLYIIPFMFSTCLFGYVFKKNSVDFIGSMPISRKSIFITNTIGGIVIIVLMQLVTFLLTMMLAFINDANIFLSMAWDIFVFQTIAYIFVFVVANLAMSLSGNTITQIAVTMLILFVVPFSSWYINNMSNNYSYEKEYTLMNNGVELMNVDSSKDYTAPFLIMNDGNYEYNKISLIKMIVLIVVYFGIGLYAFNKKKMEIAGESFENKYVHFAVKGLTLIPLVAILKAVVSEESEMAIAMMVFAIIFVYYLVFDLISSKKMKFMENVFAMLLSVITLYGFYTMAIAINDSIDYKVELKNIKSVSVNINNKLNTTISDKSKILEFVTSVPQETYKYSSYDERRYWVSIELLDNCGKKYTREISLGEKTISTLFNDSLKNSLLGKDFVVANEYIRLTEEEKKELMNYMNETFNSTSLKDLLKNIDEENELTLGLYEYKDHKYISTFYPVIEKKNQKLLMKAYNRNAVDVIKSGFNGAYISIDSLGKFNDEQMEKMWFAVNKEPTQEIYNFILNHANDVPEDYSKCIKINTYKFYFFTDKIDEVMAIIDKICSENQEEFNQYKKEMSDDYSSFPKTSAVYDDGVDVYIEESDVKYERKEAQPELSGENN